MQKFATVAFVSLVAASTANAQMKPAPAPTTTQQQGAVRVDMNQKGLQQVPEAPLESAKRIGRDEAIKLVKAKKAVFVDVRSKESYDAEHIKGAVSIPLSDIVKRVKELPRGREIITYCA
jgi:predicted sulfurtransferase